MVDSNDKTQNTEEKPKEVTIESLQTELMQKDNTLTTLNKKVTKLVEKDRENSKKIKEYEDAQVQATKTKEDKLKEAGELKPLLEAKEAELQKLQTELDQLKQTLADNTKNFHEKELRFRIKSKLGNKIKSDWTKEEDPVEEALKLYPISEITVDDNNQPTNEDEITKQFFEKYPGIMVAQSENGADATMQEQHVFTNTIGPGSTTQSTIPTNHSALHLKIAKAEQLQPDVVKSRLEGPKKERWQQDWAHYIHSEKRVFNN